jgi:hypothetical protein
MKTLLESVQIYKPATHDALFAPEIKLIARRKIQISLHDGSPDDARWIIGTLLTVLGEFNPANHPNANN